MLGLGSSLYKAGKVGKSIIRDGLVLRHDYNAGAVEPCSTGAASFDGADDYIDLGTQSATADMTISAWIFKTSDDANPVIRYGKSLVRLEDSATTIRFWGDTTASASSTSNVQENNVWQHWCFTITGTTANIYKNGVFLEADTITAVDTAAGASYIGRHGSGYFNGNICNVGYWDAALTQPQIKSIMHKDYASLSASEKTNLVSWWNLDETLGGSGGTSVVINNNDNTLGEELITGFTNGATYPFDTFTSSGKNISAAVETSGDWGGCASNTLNLTEGEVYKCTFNLTYNSGDDTIRVLLASTNTGAATAVVDEIYYTNTNGVNEVYFRVKTTDSSSYLQLGTWHESDVINFSVTDISLKRVSGNTGILA